MRTLQIELKHYIDNHGFETIIQDNGVVALIPVSKGRADTPDNFLGCEAHYCETYREARNALGY